jgi:Domain of unknown function (DUF4350)
MPLGIAGSDRKLLLVGGLLLLLLMAMSAALSPPEDQTPSRIPSTYSTQSDGAEAAYILLTRLHYPVRRWQDAPTELPPPDESNVLLILAEPEQLPSKSEREAIVKFVQNGGHVLFTGSNLPSFFPDADISWVRPDPKWISFSPNLPSRLASNASHITIQPKGYWGNLNEAQLALYGDVSSRAVVSWSVGNGEILWWAGSTPLTNAGITQNDNLAFFLNSVSNWSRSRRYAIYWDEYFHGQRNSLWSYARKTSITWGIVQIGLIATVVLFTFGRRSGPVYRQQVVSRLSPLEYVDTLGGLYERAGAAPAAVSVSYQRLRYVLSRQLGLPSDVLDDELARLAVDRLGWKDFQAKNVLGRADEASHALKLKTREALGLVQELESYAEKLEVRPKFRQEKI